jgi:Domain of unknown function (DUF5060)/Domain of unknown function (DUF5605)/Protein of unknown function (DUF4038)
MNVTDSTETVEQWDIFELALHGSAGGNPYLDVELTAQFTYKHRMVEVDGFYDGNGIYHIRFMPDAQGTWRYFTRSNLNALNGAGGTFTCVAPTPGNHGPVQVSNTYHFTYADETPYKQVGTTCYAWTHQSDELEEQTLATLHSAPFNKLRMCIFPKHYLFNENEPALYPFPCLSRGSSTWDISRIWAGETPRGWSFDFSRFDPAFFQHLERRVADLMALGIEADIILFHPYDRWGFATMDAQTDERYLRYVVARLAAYRNVWWSIANEYDLLKQKTMADWDRFFRIVQERDPYQHPRSIHNCFAFYDHAKPWVTHLSIQRSDLAQTRTWREQYRKPVVVDECCYEGNIPPSWGNISAEEMVHRFWEGAVNGGYVGHGETFLHPEDILWWAKGGVLRGQSAPRLAFLRRILEDSPAAGLDPVDAVFSSWTGFPCAGQPHDYYLAYFERHQPAQVTVHVPEDEQYRGEVIDTWGMTVTPLEESIGRGAVVQLPGKPYQALIMRRIYEAR